MSPKPVPPQPRPRPADAPADAPRIVVVVGPTASGKTRLGIELARALGGEILSADSQQVYRGLDIGTAKPTAAERAAVPHHLIDLAEPTESLSAGDWARRADARIGELTAGGRLPVVVGGTGLWVRALLLGIIEAPAVDPRLRAELEARWAGEGSEALHADLARIDPETAAATPAANRVRVLRALELHALTGEKPSARRARHGFGRLRYRMRLLGVTPPREELYRRIDARVRAMYDAGLVEEVRALVARGLREAPALRALGYPQALAVAEGASTPREAMDRTALLTRHYAKRQLTWWRADPLVEWVGWPPDTEALATSLRAEGFAGAGL